MLRRACAALSSRDRGKRENGEKRRKVGTGRKETSRSDAGKEKCRVHGVSRHMECPDYLTGDIIRSIANEPRSEILVQTLYLCNRNGTINVDCGL